MAALALSSQKSAEVSCVAMRASSARLPSKSKKPPELKRFLPQL
jgi:hypothetical protein